uniref:C1q domain-containing protein n=1 Tax=Pygocentrus nattereri TaxID=42514 RepID=A0A3B4D3I9_PYGNA
MRVSMVLLLLCLSSVHLHRAVDQLVVGDEQTEFTQSQIEELKKQYAGLEGSVDSTELSAEEPVRRKVAFSYASGLKGSLGPCNKEVIVPFHKKITDVGNAFNPMTGVFTAPLRGVYYFRFNLYGSSYFYSLAACLYKNHEKILDVTKSPRGWYKYVVGGATLLLRKGDHVYVKLKRKSQIHDDNENHCTFSGFLLFPM